MAGPFDEFYVESRIPAGSVLDFGCAPGVFAERLAKRADVSVTGIDLYDMPPRSGVQFVRGDVRTVDFGDTRFDTVCCVSSWEHCGIETVDCTQEHLDLRAHLHVAKRLRSLIAPGGRLLITCPFGPNAVWMTYPERSNALLGTVPLEEASPAWGYRTFTLDTIVAAFAPLRAIEWSAAEHRGGDYFNLDNWAPISVDRDVDRYAIAERRAVIGATLME